MGRNIGLIPLVEGYRLIGDHYARLVYNLRFLDKEVVANCFFRQPVLYENHLAWLEKQTEHPFYLALLDDGTFTGFIRGTPYNGRLPQNIDGVGLEIHLAVVKEYRCQGLARQFVTQFIEKEGPGNYYAKCLPHNHPSHRVFEGLFFSRIWWNKTVIMFKRTVSA